MSPLAILIIGFIALPFVAMGIYFVAWVGSGIWTLFRSPPGHMHPLPPLPASKPHATPPPRPSGASPGYWLPEPETIYRKDE